jgi:hypothetical protein
VGCGAMAQLVARLHGMQKVRGSNPLSSTSTFSQVRRVEYRMQLPRECPPLAELGNRLARSYSVHVPVHVPTGQSSFSHLP